MSSKVGLFGAAVIGAKQFAKEAKVVKKGSHIFGPAVVGAQNRPHPKPNVPGPGVQTLTPSTPADIVAGKAGVVVQFIRTVESLDALDAIEAAEFAGKGRVSVLDAINVRSGELTASEPTED